MPQKFLALCLLLSVGHSLSPREAAPEVSSGSPDERTQFQELRDEVSRGFSSQNSLFGFGIAQDPANSRLNPNNFQNIPRFQTEVDVRPDLNLNFRQLELTFKPRLEIRWQRWEDGARKGDSNTEADAFVHQWLARYRLTNQLFVSYGRETLQWGPAYLLSPSNPFLRDNGQNNPKLEVPGMDYGRVIWIPGHGFTLSLIANTDKGRQELIQHFQKAYAMKVDYSSEKKYFSLIASYREDQEVKVGFFGGWTVSDALLVHAEGSVGDKSDDADILIGGAYTLELGPTIVAEFFHDGDGCILKRIALCFAQGIGNAQPSDILFRRNYLLVQYSDTRILDKINLRLRWIRNLDDESNRLNGIVEYELGDRTQLFIIGNVDNGTKDDEFGSLLHYSVMLGIRFNL